MTDNMLSKALSAFGRDFDRHRQQGRGLRLECVEAMVGAFEEMAALAERLEEIERHARALEAGWSAFDRSAAAEIAASGPNVVAFRAARARILEGRVS